MMGDSMEEMKVSGWHLAPPTLTMDGMRRAHERGSVFMDKPQRLDLLGEQPIQWTKGPVKHTAGKLRGGAYKMRMQGARRPERKVLGKEMQDALREGCSLEGQLRRQVTFIEKQVKRPVDSTGVRSYLRFCDRMAWPRERILPTWGKMVDNLVLYVTDAVQGYVWHVGPLSFTKRAVKPDTAAGYAREVAKWYAEECGVSEKVHMAARVQSVLKVLREAIPAGSEQKEGLTAWHMQEIMRVLDAQPNGKMWKAMMSLAWIGLLRPAEFVVPSEGKYDVTSHAAVDNVIFYHGDVEVKPGGDVLPTRMVFIIKKSKTDQDRLTRDVVVGPTGKEWCPMMLMWEYMSMEQKHGFESLFTIEGKPVTYRKMRVVLAHALETLHLEPKRFGGHSFRIGGAQALAAAGKSIIYIMSYGRWRCVESVLRYVATPTHIRELDSRDMILAVAEDHCVQKAKTGNSDADMVQAVEEHYGRHSTAEKLWMARRMVGVRQAIAV